MVFANYLQLNPWNLYHVLDKKHVGKKSQRYLPLQKACSNLNFLPVYGPIKFIQGEIKCIK